MLQLLCKCLDMLARTYYAEWLKVKQLFMFLPLHAYSVALSVPRKKKLWGWYHAGTTNHPHQIVCLPICCDQVQANLAILTSMLSPKMLLPHTQGWSHLQTPTKLCKCYNPVPVVMMVFAQEQKVNTCTHGGTRTPWFTQKTGLSHGIHIQRGNTNSVEPV